MQEKTKEVKCGVIYILKNPSFQEFVKIGYTDDFDRRLKEFNDKTYLPFSFYPYATFNVYKRLVDKDVHKLLDNANEKLRVTETKDGKLRRREFYAIDAERAFQIIYSALSITSTPIYKKYEQTKNENAETEIVSEIQQRANELRKNFWEQFGAYYNARDNLFQGVSFSNHYTWCSKTMKGTEYVFWVTNSSISVRLKTKDDIFNKLNENRAAIDIMFSVSPIWNSAKNEIKIENTELRITQKETWQLIFEFMTDTMKKLRIYAEDIK